MQSGKKHRNQPLESSFSLFAVKVDKVSDDLVAPTWRSPHVKLSVEVLTSGAESPVNAAARRARSRPMRVHGPTTNHYTS